MPSAIDNVTSASEEERYRGSLYVPKWVPASSSGYSWFLRIVILPRIDERYCDRVKNSYSLSRTILRFAIGDEHLEQVDDNDFVEIAEPISAAELFRLENM